MADGQNYYGRPALRPAPFDWKVASYTTIGGVAGASQMIAAAASACGGRRMKSTVRNGRYLALAAGATGPLFLIAHLKTPDRWYNMLRIIRPTSAMSLGSWILSGFGLFSGITAAASFLGDRRHNRALARAGDGRHSSRGRCRGRGEPAASGRDGPGLRRSSERAGSACARPGRAAGMLCRKPPAPGAVAGPFGRRRTLDPRRRRDHAKQGTPGGPGLGAGCGRIFPVWALWQSDGRAG